MIPVNQMAKQVLQQLLDKRYQAFWVGGCVRDFLLKRRVDDYDLATDARPEEVIAIFPGAIPVGIKHGTVMVVIGDIRVEITTFREELHYEDRRWPKVQYIKDLASDLKRRDFTINAMAMDVQGRLFDPYGGKADLQAKTIRAVGEAEQRFSEDALRMLRALRFAAVLGFEISCGTWEALCHLAPLIRHISRERILLELQKMTSAPFAARGWLLLLRSGIPASIPAFQLLSSLTEGTLNLLSRLPHAEQRWALLLLSAASDEQAAERFLSLMGFSNKSKAEVLSLFKIAHTLQPSLKERERRLLLLHHGKERMLKAVELLCVFHNEGNQCLNKSKVEWEEREQSLRIRQKRELAVNGNDLLHAAQQPAGPWIGRFLQESFERVALGEWANEPEELLSQFKRNGRRWTAR